MPFFSIAMSKLFQDHCTTTEDVSFLRLTIAEA